MNSRVTLVAFTVAVLVLLAGECLLLSHPSSPSARWFDQGDAAKTAMVDRLTFTDTAAAFSRGSMKHVALASDEPARIVLAYKKPEGYPIEGTWTSPKVRADFPFTELLPSWNLTTPAGTGVIFTVRVRDAASGEWTDWLRIGAWGRVTQNGRRDECDLGRVKTDTLFLDRPADAYQIRATFQRFNLDSSENPSVRRIAVTYSGKVDANSLWAREMTPATPREQWARDLNVPYIPQGDNADPVTGMTCSPTSTSMVLRYWGIERPTMENCLAIWDDHNDLFGNWANATQRAAELGMDAWLQRFRNWEQVKAVIARGQPIVASIEYQKGTFNETPELEQRETDGHLLVIRGFTPDGNVIVNDPGNRKIGNGLVLSARGLGHAWLGHGGVGYIIRPPAKPLPATLVKLSPTTLPSAVSLSPAPPVR